MGNRGPKSNASLTVVPISAPPPPSAGLCPPADMSPDAAEVFRRVVAANPGAYCAAQSELIQCYATTVAHGHKINKMVREADPEADLKLYAKLLGMQAKNTQTMMSLATKLRLTPSSHKADRPSPIRGMPSKPWE